MRRFALCLFLLAIGATPALAAEPPCSHSLAELKAAAPKGAKLDVLNAGQYHFAAGLFVATPPVSPTIPPSDGAVLIVVRGGKAAKIMWTSRGKVCDGGFDLSTPMARLVLGVNPKPGETIDPSDDGEERSL